MSFWCQMRRSLLLPQVDWREGCTPIGWELRAGGIFWSYGDSFWLAYHCCLQTSCQCQCWLLLDPHLFTQMILEGLVYPCDFGGRYLCMRRYHGELAWISKRERFLLKKSNTRATHKRSGMGNSPSRLLGPAESMK